MIGFCWNWMLRPERRAVFTDICDSDYHSLVPEHAIFRMRAPM